MRLLDYAPQSKLQVKTTQIQKPRFPVIDAHNHINAVFNPSEKTAVSELLARLDTAGVKIFVDLDGG